MRSCQGLIDRPYVRESGDCPALNKPPEKIFKPHQDEPSWKELPALRTRRDSEWQQGKEANDAELKT